MGSHLKIFDTQNPEQPSEMDVEFELEQELADKRALRLRRRNKRRRITASFSGGGADHAHIVKSNIDIQNKESARSARGRPSIRQKEMVASFVNEEEVKQLLQPPKAK